MLSNYADEVTHHLKDSGAQWIYSTNELSSLVIEASKKVQGIKVSVDVL